MLGSSIKIAPSPGVFGDDVPVYLGAGNTVAIIYETADANANHLHIVFPEGGATDVPVLAIGDASMSGADTAAFASVTEPSVAIWNDALDAYIRIDAGDDGVAGSKGVYFKAAADEDIELLNLSVTGTPRIFWDESEDAFSISKGLRVLTTGVWVGGVSPDVGNSFYALQASASTWLRSDIATAGTSRVEFNNTTTTGLQIYCSGGERIALSHASALVTLPVSVQMTPATGGYVNVGTSCNLKRFYSEVTLATDSDTTTVGLTPAAVILSAAIRVSVQVTGLDEADHHIKLGVAGSTAKYCDASQGGAATTISVNKKAKYTFDPTTDTEAAALILTIDGGSDNTPGAGKCYVEVVYLDSSNLADV